MTQQELYKKILDRNDGKLMLTRHKLIKILGVNYSRVDKIVEDLTPMYNTEGTGQNRAKLYFVDDVAREIIKKGL